MSMERVLDEAVRVFGAKHQCMIAMEELAELIQAISKVNRERSEKHIGNLAEEIADVSIMLEQLQIMFDISDGEIYAIRMSKLDRLSSRIDERRCANVGKDDP